MPPKNLDNPDPERMPTQQITPQVDVRMSPITDAGQSINLITDQGLIPADRSNQSQWMAQNQKATRVYGAEISLTSGQFVLFNLPLACLWYDVYLRPDTSGPSPFGVDVFVATVSPSADIPVGDFTLRSQVLAGEVMFFPEQATLIRIDAGAAGTTFAVRLRVGLP